MSKAITPQAPREVAPKAKTSELVQQEAAPTHETAASVLAAQSEAMVKARTWLAMQRPRDLDSVREKILRECSRPSFAEEALYAKPVGGEGEKIEGLSIRFAEAAAAAMGNIATDAVVIFDDGTVRRIRVTTQDLETNLTHARDLTFRKVIERRFLRKGDVPISSRTNSQGQTVYLRAATDDEMLNTEGALVSKTLRTLLLRLIPGWLQAECEAKVREVLKQRNAADPDAQRRRLFDSFNSLGIPVEEVKALLGHDAATLTPKEHAHLLGIYNAIKAGESTWHEVLESRLAEVEGAKPAPSAGAAEPTKTPPLTRAQALAAKVAQQAKPSAEDTAEKLRRLAQQAQDRPLVPMPPAGAPPPPAPHSEPRRTPEDEEPPEPGSDG